MAIPVARVHLKMAHAALPALLPTPPKWKMLPLLPTPCVAAAALQAKAPLAKPSRRADSDERWDAHKTKSATTSASSNPRSTSADSSIRTTAAGRRSSRKSATSPPPKPGRADSVERWDAHKKAASPASSSSSSSSSGMSSHVISSSKWTISRASSSAERWDVHKKHRPPQAVPLDDGESSSTGSNGDIDTEEEEEEIVWKPRAMYAGPGFAVAAPEPSMLPMPTSFLVPVAS
ncbi:putative protein TPRXL [Sorghum bicolor]|uniref:putative protein TPRXL n=1 Tax=Sorghum bicolor TaxID=4558 RepID=UPI00081ACB6B|nr:putative protein TPRXL [Sorghum bicolor]|eukprot:XP_002449011.2 putative protein TPRXL [Sorghum bicolor]